MPSVETQVLAAAGSPTLEEFRLPTRSCGDFFIVDAFIDGSGPYPLLMDTGAGTTTITPKLSKQAGVSDWIESFQIDRFHADGHIPCQVQELDHISRVLGMEIQGIVGYGVFEGVLLTYDYPQQKIRVQRGKFSDAELAQENVVPTSDGSRPFIRVSTQGHSFTALLDTGSSRSLTFTKLSRFDFEEAPRPTGARMRVNGMFLVKSGRLDGDLKVGPLLLRKPILHDSTGVNLIGQQVLRDFVITFDQSNHYVRFESPNGQVSTAIESLPLYGTGIVSAPREDRLIVRRIFEGTAAETAGVQMDDEILAIDGVAIADRGCAHHEYSPQLGPEMVELLIERNGQELTLRFKTEVLVY